MSHDVDSYLRRRQVVGVTEVGEFPVRDDGWTRDAHTRKGIEGEGRGGRGDPEEEEKSAK